MQSVYRFLSFCLSFFLGITSLVFGANQTPDVSPIITNGKLPFRVRIEQTDFSLPNGIQSYVLGTYKGQWLLLAGRTNGVHGFNNDPNNFPPEAQNTEVYVVDVKRKKIYSRSLNSSGSGLTQDQVESLSVTSPQFYQSGRTLYITGGYGFKTSLNNYITFDLLTSLDIPGVIRWVKERRSGETLAQHIRQISDPTFQITGGDTHKLGRKKPTLLVFGQDFEGAYFFGPFSQVYSEQVRRFDILNSTYSCKRKRQADKENIAVDIKSPKPPFHDPNYRRRDLNVVPVTLTENQQDQLLGRTSHNRCKPSRLVSGLVAYSGVFTLSGGAWTVPVFIDANGNSFMADPAGPLTFKQGMNNYVCANLGLFSKRREEMYTILFGGITYGYFENNVFKTNEELPFTNQVTAIKIDRQGKYTQYLLDAEYPVILSTQSNPGQPLLFGAGALFIPSQRVENIKYSNDVLMLDKIKKSILVGYIVGGIQSSLPNTVVESDSAASPYIFKVILEPLENHCEQTF